MTQTLSSHTPSSIATRDKMYLLPGQLVIAQNHETVWTLLGSCVSIIFHHPQKAISAVCHAQLPVPGKNIKCTDSCPHPCRRKEMDQYKYVTCSFRYMWDYFHEHRLLSPDVEVSLYGGANMMTTSAGVYRVGEGNIQKATELLRSHQLVISHQHIGGFQSRKLLHDSRTGKTELLLGESTVSSFE